MSETLRAYRPCPADPPALVRREDLDPLTWTGMLLDGTLVRLWRDVALRAGTHATPAHRLAALVGVVPPRCVVGHRAAAWVHAGGPAPERVEVLVRTGTRRADPHPWRRAVEANLVDDDVLALGLGRVTTVQRTGLDVARYTPPGDAHRVLVGLLPYGFDAAEALARLDGLAGARNVHRARSVLARLVEVRRG